jgi:Protein of unknown function with PCYCGC motif
MKRILVTNATMAGSTAEVARAVGEEIAKRGIHIWKPHLRRLVGLFSLLVILLPGILATGCAVSPHGHDVKMAPLDAMPQEVQNAPAAVREAYQFAVANPNALKNVPCYCGCGAIGHKSNYACFVKDAASDRHVIFDQHALGCSLCVDIAQDVLRLTKEGKSPGDIHGIIVGNYSRYGPPNQ